MFKPRFIEWDPGNEEDHVAKRGIPFAIGADVFIDADRVEISAKPDRFGSPRFKLSDASAVSPTLSSLP